LVFGKKLIWRKDFLATKIPIARQKYFYGREEVKVFRPSFCENKSLGVEVPNDTAALRSSSLPQGNYEKGISLREVLNMS
jgi:hypothetical protein